MFKTLPLRLFILFIAPFAATGVGLLIGISFIWLALFEDIELKDDCEEE